MSDKHYVHPHDENELAKVLKQSRTWFEDYGTLLIYGLAALLAVAAVWVYFQRIPPATADVSAAVLEAKSADDYRDVADRFPESDIGILSRLRQADLLYNDAMRDMFANRKSAIEQLDAAQKAYERLAERTDCPDEIRERVAVGMARIAEARCDGTPEKLTAAVTAWKKVLESHPDSRVFRSMAEERTKRLQQESAGAFYAWFHKQDPKPGDDLLMPQDHPSSVPNIPDPFKLPDFSFPDPGTSTPSGAGNPADPKPTEKLPAASAPGEPAPAEPATPTPAEPLPSEPATPAPAEPAAPAAPAQSEK